MSGILDVLEEARTRGLLGPGPVEEQVRHSRALARLAGGAPGSFLDLGSGGGVPGLVLTLEWPAARTTLLDSHQRACTFLEDAVDRLELGPRVTVACGRAEELARKPSLRRGFDLVAARSFAPPAVTAECAAGFLRPGGRLVVSEPPGSDAERWPEAGLGQLGLGALRVRQHDDATVAVMSLLGPPDDRWPRRTGIPAKRPLW